MEVARVSVVNVCVYECDWVSEWVSVIIVTNSIANAEQQHKNTVYMIWHDGLGMMEWNKRDRNINVRYSKTKYILLYDIMIHYFVCWFVDARQRDGMHVCVCVVLCGVCAHNQKQPIQINNTRFISHWRHERRIYTHLHLHMHTRRYIQCTVMSWNSVEWELIEKKRSICIFYKENRTHRVAFYVSAVFSTHAFAHTMMCMRFSFLSFELHSTLEFIRREQQKYW